MTTSIRICASIPRATPHAMASALLVALLGSGTAAFAGEPDHTIVGLGAASVPGYKGSAERNTRLAPLIDVKKGRFFAKTDAGLGVNLYEHRYFTLGASVNWMKGYEAEDAPSGVGEVKDAMGGRVFVSTHISGAVATFSATQALNEKQRGLQLDAKVAYPWKATDKLTLIPSLAISGGNAKHLNSYFGIDAQRASRSGLPQYRMKAGVKEVTFGASASYQLSEHWAVAGGLAFGRLLGDAADSPIVERKSNATGLLGLTYAF